MFIKTQEQLANYVGRMFTIGGTMSKAVETLNKPTMKMPSPPNGYGTNKCDPTAKYLWELEAKETIREKKNIKEYTQTVSH